ncbi:MAG: zinc ribbon domain-containing protein [Myxococcota bacterium]|nr:zinc ribbon domain-containing protein [Myxococcota bacterium]
MTNGSGSKATYEMLWDCHFCDTKKLLGLTHRFCPTCGAPQDASWRYYPSDAEKVKVENHVFTGADRKCPACANPTSAKAKCCSNCGSPLEEGAAVAQRQDKLVAVGKSFEGESEKAAKNEKLGALSSATAPGSPAFAKAVAAAPSAMTKLLIYGLLGVFAVVIVIGALIVLWRKDVSLTVNGHAWEREVRIESFGPVESRDWRGEIPAGAQVLSCTQEKKGTRSVPDGQDCQMRECTTKYREEPEYADKCTYRINKWAYSRSEVTRGQTVAQLPAWPVVNLQMPNMAVVGGERENERRERYTLQFTDHEGKPGTCELSEAKWRTVSPGSRWKTTASVIGNMVDCEQLKPAERDHEKRGSKLQGI